jgi:hypothetical protein
MFLPRRTSPREEGSLVNVSAIVDIAGDTDRPEWQATRLAEFVFHLTDCSADQALLAVSTPSSNAKLTNDEALARVAAAIVSVRR